MQYKFLIVRMSVAWCPCFLDLVPLRLHREPWSVVGVCALSLSSCLVVPHIGLKQSFCPENKPLTLGMYLAVRVEGRIGIESDARKNTSGRGRASGMP